MCRCGPPFSLDVPSNVILKFQDFLISLLTWISTEWIVLFSGPTRANAHVRVLHSLRISHLSAMSCIFSVLIHKTPMFTLLCFIQSVVFLCLPAVASFRHVRFRDVAYIFIDNHLLYSVTIDTATNNDAKWLPGDLNEVSKFQAELADLSNFPA